MSVGNDTALPPVLDQTTPPAAADNAAPPAAETTSGLTFVYPQPIDPDDVDLAAAKTEVQAEKASDDAAPGVDATNGQDGQQQPPAAAAPGQTAQTAPGKTPNVEVQMIPKPRLDEALAARSEAERAAAYWQGVAKAREPAAAAQPGQQQQQQAQPTPQEKLVAITAEQDALALRFDAGEISMADFKKAERQLNAAEQSIREEALAARLRPAQQPASNGDDLRLNELTADLEKQHPWVQVFDQVGTDRDWDYLKATAIDNLVAKGIDPTKGNYGRLELRREMSALADELGPSLIGKRAQAQGIILPSAQAPAPGQQQQQQQQRSPNAAARASKLELASGAPPDISSMTGHQSSNPGAPPTDIAIEGMSEADYDKLPAGVRNKLLGISA